MDLNQLISEKRAEKGWSQAELAQRAGKGVKQQDVDRIEKGLTKTSKHFVAIREALGITPEVFGQLADVQANDAVQRYREEPQLLGRRNLRVFAAAEGGAGEMVISTEVIDLVPRPWFFELVPDAYAVIVTGDSMEPVYEPGDMVLVNPRLPCIRGKDAIFVAGEEHGEFKASIKRYVGATDTHWLARQFNPPAGQKDELRLARTEWARALRVVGKYTG